MPPSHIAVLGGGLSGLSAAFHLSRKYPSALITLIEKQQTSGGWVRSERVNVHDKHGTPVSILLEAGPRTLRPNAKSLLELINLLGLSDSIITTSKSDPAAKHRFLHLPGHPGLVSLPSSVPSVFTSSLKSILLPAVLKEPLLAGNRPHGITDESFDSFLTRRFGEPFARTLGSALVHGIYAADSRKLSVRTTFPSLWNAEDNGRGSVARGMIFSSSKKDPAQEDYDLGNVAERMKSVSVYSFKDGLRTLTNGLENDLKKRPNVRLLYGTSIRSLELNPDQSFSINLASGDHLTPSHTVSALPLPILQTILSPTSHQLPHLTANQSSTVTVINLIFGISPSYPPIHPPGFGYLIPRPVTGYDDPTYNKSGFLGAVFDSCALSAQDTPTASAQGSFTKMTIMMGGPYNHRLTVEDRSLTNVLKCLASQLGVPQERMPEPLVVRINENKDCIPLYGVGHLDRMKELRDTLTSQPWGGRFEVIGAGVEGVSVGDCVEAGRKAGRNWS